MTKSDDKRVPALRFKGFTDEWEQRKLGHTIKYIGTGKSKCNDKSTGKYKILGSTGVIGYSNHYDYDGDFILTARVGANAGKLYRHSGKVKITDNTVFIQGPQLNFIYYLLSNFDLKKLSFDSGQPLIKASELKKLFLNFPITSIERKNIGIIFNKLECILSLQQRKVKLINKLKNALLTHFISKTSSQSASKTLKDITNIRGGYAFKSSEFTKSGFPVIKIANISQNGEIEGPYSYVLSLKSDYQLAKNDIVLAMSGATTGKIARVNSNNIYLQNQRVGYFVNNHKIDYNYLYYLLISDQFKRQLERILISGAQPNVSASDIEKFKFVILKSKKQQSKISTLFKHIDYALKAGNNKMHTLIQIKQFLLQNMFI